MTFTWSSSSTPLRRPSSEISLLSDHLPMSPQLGGGSSVRDFLLPLHRANIYTPRHPARLLLLACVAFIGLGWVGVRRGTIGVNTLSLPRFSMPSAASLPPLDPIQRAIESTSASVDPNDVTTWLSPTPELPQNANLQHRLSAWNMTPISTAVSWARFNQKTCPPSVTDVNKLWGFVAPVELPGGPWSKWWSNPQEIANQREDIFKHMLDAQEQGLFNATHYGTGRGIIFSAGNLDTFYRVLVSIRLMRRHFNTTLPVEVFSFPGENCPSELLAEYAELGATLRTLTSLAKDPARNKNWHIKASAIIESSFREVLYMDSDNMISASLEGPDSIFDSDGFKRLGMFFWPDYWKTVAHNPVWQIIGVQCRDEWEQEAGQILIDKSRHLDVLRLTEYMLLRYKSWFALSDGDKDLFRFAALALRKRWAVPGAFVGSASWGPSRQSDFCGHTMVQHDHLGKPLFVHANMLKKLPWSVPFSSTNKQQIIWGRTRRANLTTAEDVDCDHLANVDRVGNGIKRTASQQLRRRAALEWGQRSWFRSTREYMSCVDQRWDDPRSEDEKLIAKYMTWMGPSDQQEISWDNPLVEQLWEDDERLRGFEDAFWNVGGKTAGIGFN